MDAGQIITLANQLKDGIGGNQEAMLLLSSLNRSIGELNGILESISGAYRELQAGGRGAALKSQ